MIFDRLENSSLYYSVGQSLEKALRFVQGKDFLNIKEDRYEIEGDAIYALINSYETIPPEKGVWEAHRKYIDIHYMVKGIERIGYSNIRDMKVKEDYEKDLDCLMLDGEGDFFTLKEGNFTIFYPEDVHMPGISVSEPFNVKKIIVKVKVP